ncbi:MAG: cytochrome c family protein [candidate division KSB1 bacterium]|nr:cytochrome c family protein [candidate division KSB1 bacterium]
MKKHVLFATLFLWLFSTLASAQEAKPTNEFAFVGTQKCKKCHLKQYKSWKKTKMASTFDVLKPGVRAEAKKKAGLDPDKDYTTDKECLPCHTTGYGKPGGFISIERRRTAPGWAVRCATAPVENIPKNNS